MSDIKEEPNEAKKYLSFQLDHGIVASHRCYVSESWNLAGGVCYRHEQGHQYLFGVYWNWISKQRNQNDSAIFFKSYGRLSPIVISSALSEEKYIKER